ncbi:hypothetical protein [Diaphorobacter aerolatus]|uniref:DUF4398 domain-containing protein n=1 Tax=Diaphorobacter aerolatus TaxID=1288495 RepID=A0A7H0GJK5_9BURK|nr:hypothetical protein [Diaphorobacter aerolatus]QNP48471.1 hypothetical protein H9K75_21495 [Diaphorobacter aerolatus]
MSTTTARILSRWTLWTGAALALAACADKPPTPDWKVNAHGSVQRASDAYLSGKSRVADQEWRTARSEVSRTGSVEQLALVELNRCAAQVASAQLQECSAFESLRADASVAEQAYADYLAGRPLAAAQIALLPEAQRKAASDVGAIKAIADPLSQLVAAGAALKAGRATPETLVTATETASAQGWSHALLGWLSLRAERARALGDVDLATALQRRMALIESQGQPAAASANGARADEKSEKASVRRP